MSTWGMKEMQGITGPPSLHVVEDLTGTLRVHHARNSAFLSAQTLRPKCVESCYFLPCDLG